MRIQNFKRFLCYALSITSWGILFSFSYADDIERNLRSSVEKIGKEDQVVKGNKASLESGATRLKATTSAASRGIAASVAGQAAKTKTSVARANIKAHKNIPNLSHVSGKDIKPKPKIIPLNPHSKPNPSS